ncbi:MAG TPA: glycosyltransferase family 4 protein [Lacipirellulaceae bacterium]|nr:glycosyltransferase family 4 protein [Lacipirellulaceae bacterium]
MTIGVFSTMTGMHWGGSEELWSRTAQVLASGGHRVCINYQRRKQPVVQLDRLAELGVEVHLRSRQRYGRTVRRLLQRLRVGEVALRRWLLRTAPDLVLVSIGYHTDDLLIAAVCRELGIPYALLLQAASPYEFLESTRWEAHRDAYQGAARCYFVSAQNRDIVESNLALDLGHAEIVDNPFNVSLNAAPAWPGDAEPWKLACVARLHFEAKGQDLLLQALRRPKWRSRGLEVTMFGADGGSGRRIEAMIDLYGLRGRVRWGGFATDIEQVWATHHALVLPSRFEGNALAMIEAMACGRTPIVTNVGRARELVDDDVSGFVAAAPTIELVDDALERAWRRRHEWQAMGALAAAAIRRRHSLAPAEDFAAQLLAIPGARPTNAAQAA